MKVKLSILFFCCLLAANLNGQDLLEDAYDKFYQHFIVDGRVDYEKIESTPFLFDQLKETIKSEEIKDLADETAQLINLYNISAIELILDHYPVTSPKEIPGFFDRLKIRYKNKTFTLDQIEKRIKGNGDDPRYHFALICAARSCPPFPREAFVGSTLDKQLDTQCQFAFNSLNYIRQSSNFIYLPQLFSWYVGDFTKNKKSVMGFVETYYEGEIPEGASYKIYPYDWALNDVKDVFYFGEEEDGFNYQNYSPSVLLQKGQYEIKMFNNLYTQTTFFDNTSNVLPQNRSSFFTSIVDASYGLKANLNVGFNLFLRASRFAPPEDSFLDILNFENSGSARFAVSHFGPSVKFSPFKNKKYSIKSILLIPLEANLDGSEGGVYLDENAYQWWNQLFYDTPISDKWRLFAEVSTIVKINRNFDFNRSSALLPLKAFFTYFPNDVFSFYGFADFTTSIAVPTPFYLQMGVGTKVIFFKKFEIELLYSDFVAGRLNGGGETYNVGFRFIH